MAYYAYFLKCHWEKNKNFITILNLRPFLSSKYPISVGSAAIPVQPPFFLELCTHGRRGGRAGFFGIIIIAIVIIILFVINISLIFTTPWITLSGENPRAWAAFLELYVVLTQYLRTNMYISWVSGNLLGVGRWDSAVFQKSSWFFHFQSSLWWKVSEVSIIKTLKWHHSVTD